MSIIYDGLKNDIINLDNFIFNSQHKKYTMYSSEFKKINISKIFNYDQNISFTLNLNGDLLHRCFFEVDIPILNLTDNIITNIYHNWRKGEKPKVSRYYTTTTTIIFGLFLVTFTL